MALDISFVDFIVGQIEDAGVITFKNMCGGCTVYCDGKIPALICVNQLFVKPTEGGRTFIKDVVEAPPYPGAKMFFLIKDKVEDKEWLSDLIKITTSELHLPKPKKKKKKNV